MSEQNRNTMHDAILIVAGIYLVYLGIQLITGEGGNPMVNIGFGLLFAAVGIGIAVHAVRKLAKAMKAAEEETQEESEMTDDQAVQENVRIEDKHTVPVDLFSKAMGKISEEETEE
ncbi:MAG: hypothetical protein Q4B22_11120 [Eubacteriales bacterium]|nr:hypothetical protein [Eubacteriales bacterium]